jgi:hypothetical protein
MVVTEQSANLAQNSRPEPRTFKAFGRVPEKQDKRHSCDKYRATYPNCLNCKSEAGWAMF